MRNDLIFRNKAVTLGVMSVLLLTLSWPTAANKVLEFDTGFKMPALAAVTEKGFYLYDMKVMEIYFFPRETLKPAFKFGRRGEGPSEFIAIYDLGFHRDYIWVCAEGKIVYFSLEGKLIKEKKIEYATSGYMPLGNNFVCRKYKRQDLIVVKILDKNLQVKKDEVESFTVTKHNMIIAANKKRDSWAFNDYFDYVVDENKLYIADSQKGFYIGVYDSEGKKLYEINRDYKKLPVTAKDKEEYENRLMSQFGKQRYEALKAKYNTRFPEYYPAYASFFVANGKIYVIIYPEKDKKHEMLVLDLQGNLLNKSLVPYNEEYKNYYFIFDGSYYYIEENEETEKWELHEIKID